MARAVRIRGCWGGNVFIRSNSTNDDDDGGWSSVGIRPYSSDASNTIRLDQGTPGDDSDDDSDEKMQTDIARAELCCKI